MEQVPLSDPIPSLSLPLSPFSSLSRGPFLLNPARVSEGALYAPPVGSGAKPQPPTTFGAFWA